METKDLTQAVSFVIQGSKREYDAHILVVKAFSVLRSVGIHSDGGDISRTTLNLNVGIIRTSAHTSMEY